MHLLVDAVRVSNDSLHRLHDFFERHRHPLSHHLSLTDPVLVFGLFFGYLLSVFLGKRFMQKRDPVPLGALPVVHNVVCIVISVYIVVEVLRQMVLQNYGMCNPLDDSPNGVGMAKALWVFHASKVVEFMDTWIMILKKNFRQISFLHVFHHSSIFLFGWVMCTFAPNGESYFPCLQNSVVHVIMYTYYFLASVESYYGKTLINRQWKFYITYVQLFQFAINVVHYAYDRLHRCDGYPVILQHAYFVYMLLMIILFTNFLVRNKGAPEAAAGKAKAQHAGKNKGE